MGEVGNSGRTRGWSGDPVARMSARLILVVLVPCALAAQTASASGPASEQRQPDITGAMFEPVAYTPLTPAERWQYFYRGALSPDAFATHAAAALYSHAVKSVPDWGQGAEGYGRRLGWTVVNNVAQSAIESGAAAVLHEDNGYYRCACSGIWRRTGHALTSQVTACRADGTRTFSFSRPIGALGGALVAASVLPERYTIAGDAIRGGGWNYAVGFPLNLLREFWPEIRRGVFRKK